MSRPESITLSIEEGEAIIARLSVYAPTRSDCERLILVVRLYFWLMFALQEAKWSLRRLRHVLFGKVPNPKAVPESEADATPIEAPQATEAGEEATRGDAVAGRSAPGRFLNGAAFAPPRRDRISPKIPGSARPAAGRPIPPSGFC